MTTLTEEQSPGPCFVGIDVGTGSARAGVFDASGQMLASAARDMDLFRYPGDRAEQSSDNIWGCVCDSVRDAVAKSGIDPAQVRGVGFDATCSLVVLGRDDRPLTVSSTGLNERNIIVWMDHRATDQAKRINATGHRVLDFVGGQISPEMETPKLLWLKENMPDTYHTAGHFLDLADFLTWRATGQSSRSVCTVTCKWTYLAHERSWDESYFEAIGLPELAEEGFARIGQDIVDAGTPLGSGLTPLAASELGLIAGTPVGAGLIDAHAGGIGTVGAAGPHPGATARMAYVFGTSACTMSSSSEQAFVPGIWGPYYSAMVPGLWLTEGGQSAAGEAIAQLVRFHPAYPEANAAAQAKGLHVLAFLMDEVGRMATDPAAVLDLAGQRIVVPDFLGNRAPFADPDAKAVVSGLDLDDSIRSLAALYVAGLMGLGHGLRQIIAAQRQSGIATDLVVISGGAGSSALVRQILADSAGIEIAGSVSDEPVLLGSAMLGAVASGYFASLGDAMPAMSRIDEVFVPSDAAVRERHDRRFRVFEALQKATRLGKATAL